MDPSKRNRYILYLNRLNKNIASLTLSNLNNSPITISSRNKTEFVSEQISSLLIKFK